MNLGKKLAEGYAVDADIDAQSTVSIEAAEPRTGPIAIVTEDVLAPAPDQPVTA